MRHAKESNCKPRCTGMEPDAKVQDKVDLDNWDGASLPSEATVDNLTVVTKSTTIFAPVVPCCDELDCRFSCLGCVQAQCKRAIWHLTCNSERVVGNCADGTLCRRKRKGFSTMGSLSKSRFRYASVWGLVS